MAKITLALLALAVLASACLVDAVRLGKKGSKRRLSEETAPVGWRHALRVKGGNFCSLKDFPPKNDGYGESILQCSYEYDNYWLWSLERTSGSGSVSSGTEIYLKIFNPMLSYCHLAGSDVKCGVEQGSATKFVIEKESGSGSIDFSKDSLVLRAGSKYCKAVGSGHSAKFSCNTDRKGATLVQLPAQSYNPVTLVNKLSKSACGAPFFSDELQPKATCDAASSTEVLGFATAYTVSLQVPGAPSLDSGDAVSFKVYHSLWRYQVIVWKVDASGYIYADDNDTSGDSQYIVMEKVSGSGALKSGDTIALKSTSAGKYCGITDAKQKTIRCDKSGSAGSLPLGYTYTFQ